MKVVINSCYGGFSLSHKAVMLYAEKTGIKLYPRIQVNQYDFEDSRLVEYDEKKDKSIFGPYYFTEPIYNLSEQSDKYWFWPRDIKRTDPNLISVVEELGEDANGKFADLKIVEIPDEINFEIEEYDGKEWVSEVHRTWE